MGQGTGLAMGFLGRLQAALQQSPEQPVPLQEQVWQSQMSLHI